MKISQLIEDLMRVQRKYGNIEIDRLDGTPLRKIVILASDSNTTVEVMPLPLPETAEAIKVASHGSTFSRNMSFLRS